VALPPQAQASLVLPDEATLNSDLKWIEASGAQLLASTDADYPAQLRPLPDAPAVVCPRECAETRLMQLAMVWRAQLRPRRLPDGA